MLKYVVPAGFVFLLLACGQQAAEKTTVITDTSAVKKTIATDSPQAIPYGADAKADTYYDKVEITDPPKAVVHFIPDGYVILDTCSGDLNLDTYTDLLVLLRKKGEQDSVDDASGQSVKRRLLLLTGAPDATAYKLAAQSDNAVYCYSCGGMMGDPYQRLVIKNGYFSVEHYGGSRERWTRTITFKYSPADSTWYLHKDGHESFDAADENEKSKTKTKIYTVKNFGKVAFDQFDVYKDVE